MFGFSQNQIWSIFIAIIMVGSIVGFAISYDSGDTSSNTAPPDNQVPTQISYTADNVEAKVSQVFSSAIIGGFTNAVYTTEVDAALSEIPGIIKISNSQFLEGDTENYRTDVVLASDADTDEINSRLQNLTLLSNIQFYPQALVTIPSEVSLISPSLGIEKDYAFRNSQLQVYVSPQTKKGDNLLISIQAVFAGDLISQVVAWENQNLTRAPQTYFLAETLPISSLGNEYGISSSLPLSDLNSLTELKSEIENSDDSNRSVNLSINPPVPTATFSFSALSVNPQADLNSTLSKFAGVLGYELQLDQNRVLVTAEKEANYPSLISDLKLEFSLLGFIVSEVTDPVVSLSGTILTGKSNEDFLSEIDSYSENYGAETTVLRFATFDVNELFVPDLNSTFPVPNNSITGFVFASSNEGDEVPLNVVVTANSFGITAVQAFEAEAGSAG